jgi:hypothetical protein
MVNCQQQICGRYQSPLMPTGLRRLVHALAAKPNTLLLLIVELGRRGDFGQIRYQIAPGSIGLDGTWAGP